MTGIGKCNDLDALDSSDRQVTIFLDKKNFGGAKESESGSPHGHAIYKKFGAAIHVKLDYWKNKMEKIIKSMSNIFLRN